jgi:hypothetical protein
MSPEPQVPSPVGLHDRNTAILRRTLSAISWLYALWTGLLGVVAFGLRGSATPAFDPKFLLLHAAVLGMAGTMQWRPRRGHLPCTAVAAAGSIAFVILDLRRGNVQAAAVDGGYILAAALLLYISRPRA